MSLWPNFKATLKFMGPLPGRRSAIYECHSLVYSGVRSMPNSTQERLVSLAQFSHTLIQLPCKPALAQGLVLILHIKARLDKDGANLHTSLVRKRGLHRLSSVPSIKLKGQLHFGKGNLWPIHKKSQVLAQTWLRCDTQGQLFS